MSKRLVSLEWVEEAEAEEIRSALDAAKIEFYETPRSNWGGETAAIYIEKEHQFNEAVEIFKAQQLKWKDRSRLQLKGDKRNLRKIDSAWFVLIFLVLGCMLFFGAQR